MADSADRPGVASPGSADVPVPALAPWAVVRVRADGVVAGWSAAAAALFGRSAADAVGRAYTDLSEDLVCAGAPHAIAEVLAGRPAPSLVAAIRRADGTTVMTAWTAVPTRDPGGRITGLLATGIQLPEVAVGEPERAAEQFWRGVFDANPLAVAVLDAGDRVLGVNARFTTLFGYAEDELLGQNLRAVLATGAPNVGPEQAARALALGEHLAFNADRRARDGVLLPVHVEAAAFETDAGDRGLVVTYRRATDAAQLEAQLLRAQRMEGVALVASGALHDLNNLFMVVLGQADALAAAPLDDEQREDLALLREAAGRASQVARAVTAFAARRDVRPEAVDVHEALTRLRPVLAQLVGRAVEVRLDLDDAPAVVQAVPAEVDQVFVNLAANARDAMPQGGVLHIQSRVRTPDATERARHDLGAGPYAALAVADTGVGMPPDVATRAFEPFFTTRQASGGTGLGLATVQRIVRRLGGVVWVDAHPGAGTTFHILLPVAPGA